MRVKRLKIENFRGVTNLDLSFENSQMEQSWKLCSICFRGMLLA